MSESERMYQCLIEARQARRRVQSERDALKTALKNARENTRGWMTTRELARLCGITPTQLSEWTSDPVESMPDVT